MTNRTGNPGYLPEAPIYDPIILEDAVKVGIIELTDPWRNWFNSITRTMGNVITHDVRDDAGPPILKDDVYLVEVPHFTTVQRDQLQNARDGVIVYNTTTSRFNFREGGTWVTFTPIPA